MWSRKMEAYDANMSSIEFETELRGESRLPLPPEVVAQLPKSGRAKVVVLVHDDPVDEQWRRACDEQFMKDDGPEDAPNRRVYSFTRPDHESRPTPSLTIVAFLSDPMDRHSAAAGQRVGNGVGSHFRGMMFTGASSWRSKMRPDPLHLP